MHRNSSHWLLGIIGFVLVCALFYGLRTDRPKPEGSRPDLAQRVPRPRRHHHKRLEPSPILHQPIYLRRLPPLMPQLRRALSTSKR